MAMHLPPVSRRRFLAGSLAAGAGLVLNGTAFADEAGADPNSWALLADTHIFAQRDEVVRGVKMAENFARVSDELLTMKTLPAGVIVNGDCAYLEGQAADYQVLAELVAPVSRGGLPVHMTLGNHDHRDRFWEALESAAEERPPEERPLESRHVAVLQTPRANWFLLDSLQSTNVTPGSLGEEQLAWLAKALDAHADKPALIVAHHHPDPGGEHPISGLTDTGALFDLLKPRRQVKAYIYGHTHHWQVGQQDGIHLINLPPVAYLFNAADPNGWVHCRLQENGATLEVRALNAEHPAHGKQVQLKWRA